MYIADMHCDTVERLTNTGEDLAQNTGHLDIAKMKRAGYGLQNFALYVDVKKHEDPLETALFMTDVYYRELQKNQESIAPVFTYDDILRNEKEGKISAVLTIEEGAVCKGEPAYLRDFYRLGVRMLTLTWNYPNELGHPNVNMKEAGGADLYTPDTVHGLTEKGIAFLEEMERLGMIPDVSHLSDAGFYDVLQFTHKPFAASHSNARAICRASRNMTDDMIRKLAERGGVIGLNFCEDFLTEQAEQERTGDSVLESIVRHAAHIVQTGGSECLGLGSDFDGIPGNRALPDASYLDRFFEALKKNGFTASMIEAAAGGNVRRLYKSVI